MIYSEMQKDYTYRVTKGNTDGCIKKNDILYIHSGNDNIYVCIPHSVCYFKNMELLNKKVTDFECVPVDEFTIETVGSLRFVIHKEDI